MQDVARLPARMEILAVNPPLFFFDSRIKYADTVKEFPNREKTCSILSPSRGNGYSSTSTAAYEALL
jgi:hypothetical protein